MCALNNFIEKKNILETYCIFIMQMENMFYELIGVLFKCCILYIILSLTINTIIFSIYIIINVIDNKIFE